MQKREHGLVGKPLLEHGGQVLRRKMRLAEKNEDERVRMVEAQFGDLVSGVPVTSSDFAQIFARHAIESVDPCAMVAGGGEQFVEWTPVVSPVEFEADALAQFVFVNLAADPFVKNVLVAGKNGFDSQHYRTLVEFEIAKERGQVALRGGQGMIVADQNGSGPGDFAADIARAKNFLVGAVGFAKVAKIFTSGGGIDGANFTLHTGDGMELSRAAP